MRATSINAALHNLRSLIVRDGQDGLEHVDALLRLRGVDPDSLWIPQKRPHHFAHGKLRVAVLEVLRGGPARGSEIARRVQGNTLTYARAYRLVYQCLSHMKDKGLVRREGRLWCALYGI